MSHLFAPPHPQSRMFGQPHPLRGDDKPHLGDSGNMWIMAARGIAGAIWSARASRHWMTVPCEGRRAHRAVSEPPANVFRGRWPRKEPLSHSSSWSDHNRQTKRRTLRSRGRTVWRCGGASRSGCLTPSHAGPPSYSNDPYHPLTCCRVVSRPRIDGCATQPTPPQTTRQPHRRRSPSFSWAGPDSPISDW
jgi:hypothetical protein